MATNDENYNTMGLESSKRQVGRTQGGNRGKSNGARKETQNIFMQVQMEQPGPVGNRAKLSLAQTQKPGSMSFAGAANRGFLGPDRDMLQEPERVLGDISNVYNRQSLAQEPRRVNRHAVH